MAIRPTGCLLILTLGAMLPASAQNPPSPRSFRFIATGPKGEPVTDLRPEEIQVTDNGKRQQVLFSHLLRVAAGGPVTLGPREVSNRGYDQLFSSTLVLLDLLNANIDERGAAWNEAVQSLKGLESADNVYLFLLTPNASIYPVHAWNPPGAELSPQSSPWTSKAGPLLDDALRKVEGIKSPDLTAAPGLTVDPTYKALTGLAREYAALPGQKRLIWVTHGMPATVLAADGTLYADFRPELKAVAQEFTRLGISVYTVHQLDRSTTGLASDETLQTIAPLTGGRWFENDAVDPAITQARADARATYQAGYPITPKEIDGKFHKLRVTTTRKNVRILAEEGYNAIAPADIAKSTLDLVASRPFDTPDIGLRALISAASISAPPGGKALHLQIRVDPRDLALEYAASSYSGEFSATIMFFSAGGQRSSTMPSVTKLNLTQEQFDAALKDGYVLTIDQAMPAGAARGRIVIQDNLSGLAGSLGFPLASN